MNDVGLTILEGVANGASPFREPSKRNIGLLMQSLRGVPFKPARVTSMEEFNVMFGGQSSSFFGPGIVRSIFAEAGDAPVVLYLARVTGSNAVAATATVTLSDAKTMEVTAGYKGSDDPGIWGNNVVATLYSYGYKSKDNFLLSVTYGDKTEQFTGATLAEIQAAVNKTSKYISVEFSAEITPLVFTAIVGTVTATLSSNTVTGVGTTFTSLKVGDVLYTSDATPKMIGTIAAITSATSLTLVSRAYVAVTATAIKKRADVAYTATLTGGSDGTVAESDFYAVESATDPKGLACFDGFDVQILASTEYHSLTMAQKLNEYVGNRKGPLGVVNLPLGADEGTAELYALNLQTSDASFLAAYMGWAKVLDEDANEVTIPVIGPVLGAGFIRTPYVQGNYIHVPPAGTDSLFSTVKDMVPQRLSQPLMNRLVQNFTCNVIQYIENTGFYVGSSRTYSTAELYMSIHTRLQTSYYKSLMGVRMRSYEQKPNTPELKREALIDLRTFFKTEYDNGALERSVDFSVAYQGICDKSNNPSTQDRKLLNIDVLWVPTECTESVRVSLQRNDGVLTITE